MILKVSIHLDTPGRESRDYKLSAVGEIQDEPEILPTVPNNADFAVPGQKTPFDANGIGHGNPSKVARGQGFHLHRSRTSRPAFIRPLKVSYQVVTCR